MTSLGLPDLRSGVATSLKESSDFLSRWLVGGGGPLVDTEEDRHVTVVHFDKIHVCDFLFFLHIIGKMLTHKIFFGFVGLKRNKHLQHFVKNKTGNESNFESVNSLNSIV